MGRASSRLRAAARGGRGLGDVLMTAETRARARPRRRRERRRRTDAVVGEADAAGLAAIARGPRPTSGSPERPPTAPAAPCGGRRRHRAGGARRSASGGIRAARRRAGLDSGRRPEACAGDARHPDAARDLLTADRDRRVDPSLRSGDRPARLEASLQGVAVPKFYLTTAIDYSNGDPHLGHALEKVGADCIARYRRLRGRRRPLPHGHGRALPGGAAGGRAERARAAGLGGPDGRDGSRASGAGSSAATTTGSAPPSRGITRRYDRAARADRAQRNPDDLYVGEYEGLYCFGCEEFKQPAQIVNGHCIEHPDPRAGADQGAEPLLPAEPLPRPPPRR